MKTLHLNYSDNKGGAAIACGRLIESLNKNNTTSELLTNEKYLKKIQEQQIQTRFIFS